VGDVYVGFFLPDYTAYEEMLSIFKRLVPIPNALKAKRRKRLAALKGLCWKGCLSVKKSLEWNKIVC